MGMFGENFTIEDDGAESREGSIHVGDSFLRRHGRSGGDAAAAALLQTGCEIWVRRHGQTVFGERKDGFYLAVLQEEKWARGDEMKLIAREANGVPVSEIIICMSAKRYGRGEIQRGRAGVAGERIVEVLEGIFARAGEADGDGLSKREEKSAAKAAAQKYDRGFEKRTRTILLNEKKKRQFR